MFNQNYLFSSQVNQPQIKAEVWAAHSQLSSEMDLTLQCNLPYNLSYIQTQGNYFNSISSIKISHILIPR